MTRCCPTFSGTSVLGSLFDLTIAATVTPYFLASEVSVSPAFTSYTRCAARGPAAGGASPRGGAPAPRQPGAGAAGPGRAGRRHGRRALAPPAPCPLQALGPP